MLWTAYLQQIQSGCGHLKRFPSMTLITGIVAWGTWLVAEMHREAESSALHSAARLPTVSARLPTASVKQLFTRISW